MTPRSSPANDSKETDGSSNSIHQTVSPKMNAPDEPKNPSAELEEAETVSFEIASEEAGARLDAFLASRISERSRARLKRAIDDGEVTVDGKIVKPSHKLRAGERVEVELTATVIDETLLPEPIPLEIVYEDDQLVVINKRAGMVVHPGAGIFSGTLANALLFHFRELSENAGAIRPGIVHRLDRDTSGLIVVAKTEGAHAALSDQFRAREVYKSYVALVHGRVKEERGKIDEPIGRDPRHRTRMSVARRGGREALSLFRVRHVYGRFTLLDVEIKTGRTHQIRVHLAWLKHPVVGDEVYGAGRDTNIQDAELRAHIQKLGRQFLHAAVLRFRHPVTAAPLSFKAELPAELNDFLDYLNMREEAAAGYN